MAQPILKIFQDVDSQTSVPLQPDAHSRKLLIIDDEAMLLEGLEEILHRQGYEVRSATHPQDALDLLNKEPFALVLADHRLPQMTGLELLSHVKLVQPNTTRVLMTGAANLQTAIESINQGEIYRFILKPWTEEELLVTVKTGVQRYELVSRNLELQRTTQAMNEQLAALNRCLEDKVKMETVQNHQLSELNRALSYNFQHSVQIGVHLLHTFYPFLGRQARETHALCQQLAVDLNLPQDHAESLRTAAWLQDIGMAGLPPSLVQAWQAKPESLSEKDLNLIKQHPILSQDRMQFVYNLTEAGKIVRGHHERFDGQGFPDGLSGEAIPWLSRLLAVASAYACSGPDKSVALNHLLHHQGSLFDPSAVDLVSQCLKRLEIPKPTFQVPLGKLRPGMILAEDLTAANGCLVASASQILCPTWIQRIWLYQRISQTPQAVAVYR